MNKKVISTTFITVAVIVFFLLPFNTTSACVTDSDCSSGHCSLGGVCSSSSLPTPNPSSGPDYTDFGSSSGNSLIGVGLGAGGCFAGVALGLFTGGSDYWYCIDNFIIRPVMRTIENSIENNMLNQIGAVVTDKLNGGKDPHFVTDWRNSLLDSSARGNDIFRSVLADTDLCPYFNDGVKQAFGADLFGGVIKNLGSSGSQTNIPGTESFQLLNKCSLSSDVNVADFNKDFTKGGWSAWIQLLQPENNPLGVYVNSLQEQTNQMSIEEKAASDENIANQGFLPSGSDKNGKNKANACSADGLTRCIFKSQNITPGKLFGDATAKTFDQKFETIGGAQEIQDLILALADSVVNKLSGRLNNLLGSGGAKLPAPNLKGVGHAICVANCQLASYPQCDVLTSSQQQLTCKQSAITACQQACP